MNLKKLLIIPIFGVLSVMSVAAAAALTVDGGANQAGNDLVLVCDEDGVQLGFRNNWSSAIDAYSTQDVTVSGIDAHCQGEIMKVTLTDVNGNYLAERAKTLDAADPQVFDFSAENLPAATVYGAHVAIQ